MVAGFCDEQLAEIPSLYCFIHKMQLVVKEMVLDQRSDSDAVARCKNYVGYLNKSTSAADKFRDIQNALKLPQKKLLQDVSTR